MAIRRMYSRNGNGHYLLTPGAGGGISLSALWHRDTAE